MRKLLSVLCLTVVLIQGILMPVNARGTDAAGKIWFEGAGDERGVRPEGSASGQAEAASQVNLSGQPGEQGQSAMAGQAGTADGTGQPAVAGQTKGADQTDPAGQTNGADQSAAAGQTNGVDQTDPAGQTKGAGQTDTPPANQVDLGVTAESAVLMEASTGTIIYEKDCDKQLRPASITKIMTLILIFDALDAGKIRLDDEIHGRLSGISGGGRKTDGGDAD